MKASKRTTITMEFSERGDYLKAIYFNAETDEGHEQLYKSLYRLTKRDHFGWIARLFRRE